MSQHNLAVLVLAAGGGTRMNSDLPKVMHEVQGKPMVEHVVDNVRASGVCEKPVVVVSGKHTLIQDYLGDKACYVVQSEQLGTGHAVAVAEPVLRGTSDHVMVLYGDMPFLKPESIKGLADFHVRQGATMTVLTANAPDFEGWREAFTTFGRVIRGGNGDIERIVEFKDATSRELGSTELSTCYFCFNAAWLWDHLAMLGTDNAQREYYLTDLVKMCIDEGNRVQSLEIDLREVVGVNSKEDLAATERLFNH